MNFGLDNDTVVEMHRVFKKYPQIEEVILYGSRAKGNFREGSDIDLTLKGHDLSEDVCAQVWLDLDELNTPYLMDISLFRHLSNPDLIRHIEKTGKTFYKAKI